MRPADVAKETFFLRRDGTVGLQQQLRETIISAILDERIRSGDRLPSSRALADYLGISRTTVTLAYQELAAQGYLEVRARSACRVAERGAMQGFPRNSHGAAGVEIDWTGRVRSAAAVFNPVRKPADWRGYPYPFIYGQIDTALFSRSAWRDCARQALGGRDFEDLAGDASSADDKMLVDYIRSRLLPTRGIDASPHEILITVGAQNALWLVIQLLLRSGRHAVHESPCHPDLTAALRLSGAKVSAVAVDGRGLPPEALPSPVDVVFVTPSHQAPTTVTMPIRRRQELLEQAHQQDFVIVEDDYEFEMSFLAPPTPAFKSLDKHGRVLYVGSFSKSIFPGLRLGYLVGPPALIREARALRALVLRHPPGHLQRTAAYFLALGHYDAFVRRMRSVLHERYGVLADALGRGGLSSGRGTNFGGSSLWVEGPERLDADKLAEELRADGVLIESGSPFFDSGRDRCKYFRLGFSSIPRERIEEGVRRLLKRLDRQ